MNNLEDKQRKMNLRKQLTDLISHGKIKEAIALFLDFSESSGSRDLYSNIIQLSSRFNRNESMHTKGLLSYQNYNLELNRISNALEEYIKNDLDESDYSSNGYNDLNNGRKNVFISYSHQEKEYAQKMKTSLEALNVDVIIDSEHLQAGSDIKSFIENSIGQTSNTISIISSKSLLSSWVSFEVIRTIHSEQISKKQFIAAFIDDAFFNRNFVDKALDKIESEITDIQALISKRLTKNRNIDDLQSELTRYQDLKHSLPTIIQRLKESYAVDIRGSNYDAGIGRIYEALI